ncbi:hypothetical protein QFC19_009183 [Naganishia cerealis]|uniref:Uncharacterized protein n=1 Tax=Naganishia cerealis TaxID=610337 RepID=A0ACC2UWP9_9TREE|nr:hypothetical protein QFC19_009183 [Naganishia cerealis]
MYIAIHRSKDALLALAFFICMALVVFSTLIYFAERGVWDVTLGTFVDAEGNPSQFESIPSAAWFVLVTITTPLPDYAALGRVSTDITLPTRQLHTLTRLPPLSPVQRYGELIPRSILGRLFTVPLLVFGLLLIALPSFVLGRNFAIVFDAMSNQIMQPIDAAAAAGEYSARGSYDGAPPSHLQHRPTSPFPSSTSHSPPPEAIRLAERGNMVGGVQYDALPLHEPPSNVSTASVGAGAGGAGGLGVSGSQQSGFSLARLEAGRTHPMFPPEEARQGKALAGGLGTLDLGGATAAVAAAASGGLGKNDLTNLKLASNQQVRDVVRFHSVSSVCVGAWI